MSRVARTILVDEVDLGDALRVSRRRVDVRAC